MNIRKSICSFLVFLLLLPAPVWGQSQTTDDQKKLEDQAQFYLQKIRPPQLPMTSEPVPGQTLPLQKAQPIQPSEAAGSKVLTAAPRQPEETSEAEIRAAEYGLSVKQFGYSFFYKPPETFLPTQTVPVGPDYLIGPGDSIKILVWGSVQGEYNLTVDNNGQIAIPTIGAVHVSGLTYRQLNEVLNKEFAANYNNFQMSVTLDNLRTIQIYVTGQARFPGSYAVSSLSTLISALFAAGGPSKTGSMRDIQVRRRNRVVAHFDMYDFLLRGDKSKDIRLQPQDVIFIPPIGPLAAIGSPAKIKPEAPEGARPGAMESPDRENGGAMGTAIYGKNGAMGTGTSTQSRSGAMGALAREKLRASSMGEGLGQLSGSGGEELGFERPGAQVVGGPIKVPGIFELKSERTLTELLKLAGGMASTAFKDRVQVVRVQNHREMVMFEDFLDKVLQGRAPNIPLVDGDIVKIFRVPDIIERKVRITGAVKKTGVFGLQNNMRVKDLIEYAGGLLMQAYQQEAEITRVTITPDGPQTSRIYINLRRALNGASSDNILLQPNDYVFIRTVPDWTLYTRVRIDGEVKFPGRYAIKKGETLSSLLSRAGGFTDKAYAKGAIFTRESVKKYQQEALNQAISRLETEMLAVQAEYAQKATTKEEAEQQRVYGVQQQALLAKLKSVVPLGRVVIRLDDPERLRGTPNDLQLQQGDSIFVPQIQETVNVLGAVVNPTAIVYDPYSTVGDYLTKAGGPTRQSDPSRLYVIKVNGSAMGGQGGFLGNRLSSQRLDPGDTIVVPEDFEKIAWLKEIKDIATILGQFALVGGVVFAALK